MKGIIKIGNLRNKNKEKWERVERIRWLIVIHLNKVHLRVRTRKKTKILRELLISTKITRSSKNLKNRAGQLWPRSQPRLELLIIILQCQDHSTLIFVSAQGQKHLVKDSLKRWSKLKELKNHAQILSEGNKCHHQWQHHSSIRLTPQMHKEEPGSRLNQLKSQSRGSSHSRFGFVICIRCKSQRVRVNSKTT